MDLVCKLNTAENKAITNDEDACIYRRFDEEEAKEYKNGEFKEIIEAITKDTNLDSGEKSLAAEIRNYLAEEDGINKIFEISVYNEDGTNKRNIANERSTVMKLTDPISPYTDERQLNDISYECLDMVVTLNTKVGK